MSILFSGRAFNLRASAAISPIDRPEPVVDREVLARDQVARLVDARELVEGQVRGVPEVVAVHPGLGLDQAMAQLGQGHFEADQERHFLAVDRRVLAKIQGEGALAHRGPGRDDREGFRLEPAQEVVEIVESRGDPGEPAVGPPDHQIPGEGDGRRRIGRVQPAPIARHSQDELLGGLDQFLGRELVRVPFPEDLIGGVDQLAADGLLVDDLGVILRVDGMGGPTPASRG